METVDVIEDLAKHGHQIMYWVWSQDDLQIDKSQFPGTIFHELQDALRMLPAPGVTDDFAPPSPELIQKLLDVETVVLPMMNKKFDWMGVSQRKRVYYRMLRYWHGVIGKYAPDVIIFPSVPHSIYDYIIFGLAKFLGIKTIMFDTTLITGLSVVLNDYRDGCRALQQTIKSQKNQEVSLTDLPATIQAYYKQKTDPENDAAPIYILADKRRYGGYNLAKVKFKMILAAFKDQSILEKGVTYWFKRFKSNLKRDYLKVATKPDVSKKFVYVPLNYQPEATTCPLGDAYVDQILMIETLAAALPTGWALYVKEHPVQWLSRGFNYVGSRYQGFYEMIAAIPNVFVLPIETNSLRLIDVCQAVATVTGTAGWEATLRGKPALVFGHPWYQDYPELFRVGDVASCRAAFAAIERGFAPTKSAVFSFLACLESAAVRMYMDEYARDHAGLTKEQNRDNIFNALIAEIE